MLLMSFCVTITLSEELSDGVPFKFKYPNGSEIPPVFFTLL